MDRLYHDMPWVATPAARKLGIAGQADAVPLLIRALRNEHRSVRFAVIEALIDLYPLSHQPLQGALQGERNIKLRHLLFLILDQLKRKAKGHTLIPTLHLLELLERQSADRRHC